MTKNILALTLAAITLSAATSSAFAGATAAQSSHQNVQAAWAELHKDHSANQTPLDALVDLGAVPVATIASTVDLFTDQTTPTDAADQKLAEEKFSDVPEINIGSSIF